MSSKYVMLAPIYDTAPGYDPVSGTVMVDPKTAQVPGTTLQGGVQDFNWGDAFPLDSEPTWTPLQNFIDDLNYDSSQIPATDPGALQGFINDYTGATQASSWGVVGQVPDGCWYKFEIYCDNLASDPNPPSECNGPVQYDFTYYNRLKYRYTDNNFPIFGPLTIGGVEGKVCVPDGYACAGMCADSYHVTNLPAEYEGPFEPAGDPDEGGFYENFYYVVKAYSCTGPDGPWEDVPLMPTPDPLTFPADIPLPLVPSTAPPPKLTSGTVTTAPSGQPGTFNFVPGPNGTYQVNVTLPDCQCKNGMDGQSPSLITGNTTQDPAKPVSGTIRQVSQYVYAVDFNLPPNVVPFTTVTIPLLVFNPLTGVDEVQQIPIYSPNDGNNSMLSYMVAVLEQLMEIRLKLDPTDSETFTPIAGS